VVAAEVADLSLDAALLVGALDAWTAVEALDADLPWVQEIRRLRSANSGARRPLSRVRRAR
jgi:hypothetical protein